MLSRARQILVSELALAQDTTIDDADTWLLEALLKVGWGSEAPHAFQGVGRLVPDGSWEGGRVHEVTLADAS